MAFIVHYHRIIGRYRIDAALPKLVSTKTVDCSDHVMAWLDESYRVRAATGCTLLPEIGGSPPRIRHFVIKEALADNRCRKWGGEVHGNY
jgi:hypothetical protein